MITVLDVFILILFGLGNVALVALFGLAYKKIKALQKLKIITWEIIIGIIFLGWNILTITYSVFFNQGDIPLRISLCLVPIVITGLLLNWISPTIVGVGSLFYQIFYNFGNLDYARYPTALTIGLVTLIIIAIRFFFFRKKTQHNYVYGFFIGLFAETIRMFVVLIWNRLTIIEVYPYVSTYDIACILISAFVVALSIFVVMLYEKEPIKIKIRDDRLAIKVQRRIFIAFFVSFAVTFALTYQVTRDKATNDATHMVVCEAGDVANTIDFLHDTPENEEIIRNIATNRHINSYGFVSVLDKDFKVISVEESYKKFLGKEFRFDNDRTLIDMGKKLPSDAKERRAALNRPGNYCFSQTISGYNGIFSWAEAKTKPTTNNGVGQTYYTVALFPTFELATNYGVSVRTSIYLMIMVFFLLYLIIVNFIERKVLDNIQRIKNSLEQIMDGNLDTQVKATGSKEFKSLSENINLTVGALKNYSDEIARRLADETDLATNIQKNSVATSFPNERNFNVYGSMRTAKEVGGDFYDYVKINDDKVAFLMADVVGNGIVAAMYMIRAKTLIKSLLVEDEKTHTLDIVSLVDKVNKELANNNTMNVGMSMWIGLLDTKMNVLTYINANHEPPIVCLDDDVYKPLPCKKNVYLGLDANYVFPTETITFNPGSDIVLYVDGLTNLKNTKGEKYGIDSLLKICNDAQYFTARQLVRYINDDLDRHAKDVPELETDITTFCMMYTGEKVKRPEHEITLKAIPNNTPIATKFVESIMQQYNCSQKSQAIMLIAVDELFSNIAYYAYKGKPNGGNGTIRIEIKGTEFKMQLIDWGTPFNPLSHLDPNYINSSAEERTNKGGLGIFMVRRSVDDMQYVYENGQNILTIIKQIPEMHEEEFKDSYSTTRD